MGIVWDDPENAELFVPGIILFGLFDAKENEVRDLSPIENIWNSRAQLKFRDWDYEVGPVRSAEIRILEFPAGDDWLALVRKSMEVFLLVGAKFVWCGDELSSPNPDVLKPGNRIGNIYAILSGPSGFIVNSSLDEDIEYIDDRQLGLHAV